MQINVPALVLEFKSVAPKIAFNSDKTAAKVQETNTDGIPAWTVEARHFDETAAFNNETDLKITIHAKSSPQVLGRNAPFVCEALIQNTYTLKTGGTGISWKASSYTAHQAQRRSE